MTLMIQLTAAEEGRLRAAAEQEGVAPEELAERYVRDNLEPKLSKAASEVDRKLQAWQAEDKTQLYPAISTQELFARWDAEDAAMTPEERMAEEELWQEITKALNDTRASLGMRLL